MEKITENHSLSGSQDILADNIHKLKEIFPEVFSEGRVDFEKLQVLLGDLITPNDDLYGLNWWGKNEAIRESMKRSLGTLRPDRDSSKNWDTTENLYIEGDNLEVLKLLQKSYTNKIKMIYIDPPYNTGKDFVYKDNYKDNLKNYLIHTGQVDSEGVKQSTNPKEDGRYHSNWLNMMYPRLKLARNLMTEDGVIFISIDDNEIHNLRKICDEIFSESNFLGLFILNSSPSGIDYGHMAKTNDYALFYGKNSQITTTNQIEEEEKEFKYTDEIGGYNLYPLYNGNAAFNDKTRPNLVYPFYLNPKNNYKEDFYEISTDKKDEWIEIYPVIGQKDGIQRVWRWGKPKSKENLNNEIVGLKNREGEFRIVQKSRLTTKVIRSLQLDNEVSSRRGTLEIEGLFGKKIFSYPKPSTLIERFATIATEKDSIVLDFFAGSSSSAHAILKLNSKDGGQRKFIQVQIPEILETDTIAYSEGFENLCQIGEERIRKAGVKILSEKKEELKQLKEKSSLIQTEEEKEKIDELEQIVAKLDIGFKVFKLDSSNIEAWDTEMPKTEEEIKAQLEFSRNHLHKGRTEEDLLYELLIKQGLMLTSPIEERELAGAKVYSISHGELFICMNATISMAVIEGIGLWGKECIQEAIVDLKPVLVLKDEAFGTDDAFKTNAELRLLNEFGFAKVNTL